MSKRTMTYQTEREKVQEKHPTAKCGKAADERSGHVVVIDGAEVAYARGNAQSAWRVAAKNLGL